MKKFFAAFAAAVLFSSCDFWNAPVKSWFEEYTQNPRVTGADFAGKYETGSDGTVYASSSEDFQVIMNLQNPLNFVFTAANMTLFLPDELPAAGIDTSTVTIMQDSSDLSKIIVTYPQVFLRLAEQGKNITPRVNLRHPKVGIDFGTFEPAAVVCNSPPPFPFGAMLYKDNSDRKYVVCFNMPSQDMLKTNALHSDILKIQINGTEFPITLNADGTFVTPSGLLQAASPAAADSHFVKRGVSYPDFQKNGQPVFFKTNDVENSDKFDYRIEIVDSGGRAGKTLISSKSVQLKTPSAAYNSLTLSASSLNSLQAVDDDDSVTVRIMPPAQAVNGTPVDGAEVYYELYAGHSASGVPIKSGSISAPEGELAIAGGDFCLKLSAHKDEYVDSQTQEYKFTVRTQVYFVKGTGAVVLSGPAADSNSGSRLFPFATVQKALSAVPGVSGMPSPYKIYIDGETSETQKITVGGSGANKSVTIERLGGAAQAVIGRAAAFTTDSLIRLEEDSSLTLKNITVDGKVVSAGGSGVSTAGTLVLSGSTVQNCMAAAGQAGGILVEKGACTLDSSIVKDCQASGKKRGVYVKAYTGGGTQPVFTVKGASQVGSSTDTTAVCLGFAVDTGALVTAQDLESGAHVNLVPENYVKQYGLELAKSTEAVFPAAAVPYFSLTEKPTGYAAFRIQAGTAASGNANALLLRETVTIDGGADTDAWAYVKYYATHILSGDDIIIQGEVKAKSSGSVMINGESVQTDGEIHVGSDVLIRGDGTGAMLNALMQDRIFVFDGASSGELTLKNLTLKNGKVTAGHKGGAALVKQNKTLILENCKIQDCEAGKGGALYVEKGGVCVLSGTRLSGNKATDAGASGGAVYAEAGSGSIAAGNVRVSGASVITKETDSAGQKRNDVCLENGALISVTGEVSGTGIIARITPSPYAPALAVVQGADGFTLPSGYENRFAVTEDGATSWSLEKSGNELKLKTAAFILDGTAHPADGWKLLKEYIASAPADSTVLIKGTIQATTASGNNGVIPITKNITIYGERSGTTITSFLDAGKGTAGKPEHRIFTVSGAGTVLTLKDVVLKNGKASGTGMDDKKGGAILLKDGAKCEIQDCDLNANEAAERGGAVFVDKGAECTITNTKIDSNIAHGSGGGIYVEEASGSTPAGKCTISGGSLTKNEAKGVSTGGGALYTAGTTAITDCTIGGNTTDGNRSTGLNGGGGGIYVFSGACTVNNVIVKGNNAAANGKGAGVRLYSSAAAGSTFTVKGATEIGGGTDTNAVYVDSTVPTQVAITADNLQSGAHINLEPGDRHSQKNQELVKGEHASIYAAYFHLTGVPAGETWNLSPNAADNALRLRQQDVIDSSNGGTWKKLKDAIAAAEDGDVIKIIGEIKATSASDNSGELVVNKNITVKKADGASTAVLNANKDGTDVPSTTHRIFKVRSGKTLTLQDLTLKGGKPDASNENGYGGGILLRGGTLDMKNCDVKGNESEGGGGIYANQVGTAASVTISGGTIGGTDAADKNKTGSYNSGGGIYIGNGCSLTMKDNAKIIGNETGVSGGGIFANTDSTLIIEHCTVSGNKASGSGGGIHASGALTMDHCTVGDNSTTGDSGGGVCVSGTAEIKGGSIIAHNEADVSGGGIYAGGGSLTLVNSTVGGDQDYDGTHSTKSKGNKAASGGGIYAKNCTLTMTQGSVSCNTATDSGNNVFGGGIYVDEGCTLTMQNDAKVSGNHAKTSGGGVYVKNGTATFTMKGSSCITPSSAGDANAAGKNDVYLDNDGGGNIAKISLPEVLSGTAPVVARITIADDQYLSTTQVLDGAAVGTEYSKFTVTPKTVSGGTQIWTIKNDGHLQKPPVEINGTDSLAWKKLKDAVAAADDGDVIKIIGEIKATNDTDNSGELVVNKNITVKKADGASSAVIDANKDAGGKPKHRIFFVRSDGTLTLDNITLQGGMAEGSAESNLGGGVYVNGTLIMKGSSKITDCSAGVGGGLFLFGTCTLQDSSSITHCEARDYGGGVCVDYFGRSILNINGGSITMNHTKKVPSSTGHGGGVYVRGNTSTKGKVVMTAGEISDNKAGFNSGSTYEGDGGGIYNSGIFEMSGGTIKSNNAKNGGGVCISDSGTFTMSGNAKIEADNDVYFGSTGGNPAFITVTGALSNSPAATLTMENIAGYAEGREVVKGDGYTLTAADIARFPITAQTSPAQNWTTELDGNTLKLKKERKTVTIKRTDANAWKKLKDEVEKTSGGAEKIIIEGTVQAKDGSKGEITVSREVEIEGNGTDAVLDAKLENRIFKVNTAGKLTIKNLKLTGGLSNGAALQSENYGGAIYNEGELTVISCENERQFCGTLRRRCNLCQARR